MIRTRTVTLLASSALGIALLSACGAGQHAAGTAAPRDRLAAAKPDAPIRLAAKKIDKLGSVVTDSNGMTLYRFDRDTALPSTSNCDGPCTNQWPPVTTTAKTVVLAGIDKHLIGTVARRDGTVQLTLAGWPLYRYAKDTAPGEARGQGVSGTWFASTPAGKKAATSTDDSGTDVGYGY
jgi:predicted lipoprotein with Yx(FWY)xxD motif